MKKLLLALGILALVCSPAMAGRNANGAMVVHTDNSINYTASAVYCNTAIPGPCEELITESTKLVEEEIAIIWCLAAFLPTSSPGVTTIQFGLSHNLPTEEYFVRATACGPAGLLELPDSGWPVGTGEIGNLVSYPSAVYSQLFPFYAFAVYGAAAGDQHFGTRTYPNTNEAKFVDDSQPPIEDLCFNFGAVRWGAPGYNDCPTPPVERGACCFADGSCQVLMFEDCAAQGGAFQGVDTVCQPNPCPQPQACCFPSGDCAFLLPDLCTAEGGVPQGDGTDCDPNICPLPPEACCFYDGHCELLPPDVCAAQEGVPQGPGTTCETVECPQPTGACCVDSDCVIVTEAECGNLGGWLWTIGEDCVDDCPVATQPSTWGQIKANYR